MTARADSPLKKTLVIGGVASFVNETARKKLARWGFSADWHIPMGKKQEQNPGAAPQCEAIVIFEDMVSTRAVTRAWQAFARERGMMLVVLDRHESHWPGQMERQGFKTIHPVAAAAVADTEEQDMARDEKDGKRVVHLPVGPGVAPPTDGFQGRKSALVELLREMRDLDGLTEILWSPESGLSLKRTIMRPVTEETSEQL
jgi:hypothetical protein